MKENIKTCSRDELSLRVFNTQGLYECRDNFEELLSLLDECFDYTQEQIDTLDKNLQEDSNGI